MDAIFGSMGISDEEATTWFSNFYEHEDFILTFQAVIADNNNTKILTLLT
jgi:hypothetical protein